MKINEVADNIFVIVDTQANIYVFTNELGLLGRSKLRISDASIIRFSKSRRLLGVASEIDRNIVIFDISLCFVEM